MYGMFRNYSNKIENSIGYGFSEGFKTQYVTVIAGRSRLARLT